MQNRLDGKLVLKGKIKLISPLLIGSGEKDNSDIDVLRDINNKPFIPATSFVGIIRNFIRSQDEKLEPFFGFAEQSLIRCSDLKLVNDSKSKIVVRDGIRVDNKTGLVEDKSKYDYEVIEPGAFFNIYIEADVRNEKKDELRKLFTLLIKGLNKNFITLGAKTNSGLGKIEANNLELFEYDFSNKNDVLNWVKKENGRTSELTNDEPKAMHDFEMKINLKLRNSLIVKSYPGSPEMPDAVNITSNGKNLLPGTSIKGALRARMERILNTIGTDSKKIINDLFGIVDTNDKKSKPKKGRIMIEEVILPAFIAELQTRIKIDRFTGGTINGALFDSMPLFDTNLDMKANNVVITLKVKKCSDYEAGLLLLACKDLWTGDLAIGGEKSIGRGVFDGVSASIVFNDFAVNLSNNLEEIPDEIKKQMQEYVNTLHSEVAK